MPRIIVPSAKDTPAALGNQTKFCIESIGNHKSIVAAYTHIHGKPVGILLCTIGSLPGSDAVTNEFQLIFFVRNRKEKAIRTEAPDQYMTGIILRHCLKLSEELHIFHGIRAHAPEKTKGIGTGHQHLTAHEGVV